jgi:hypothetical protein
MELKCPLCSSQALKLKLIKPNQERYWDCQCCQLIFLDRESHLSLAAEKAHYLHHNNDVNDEGYQNFLSPMINYIEKSLAPGSVGLDYGAGPGPAAVKMLRDRDYQMHIFDPYFANDPKVLTTAYDFILTSEVVEHFIAPIKEFRLLKSLLKPNAPLVVMTGIYHDEIDFSDWYYHRDPTHVVFYREETFNWIKNYYHFSKLKRIHQRVMVLE